MFLLLALLAVGVTAAPYKCFACLNIAECTNEDAYIDPSKGYYFQATSVVPTPDCLLMWYWLDEGNFLNMAISTSGMGEGDSFEVFTGHQTEFYQSFKDQDLFNKNVSVPWPPATHNRLSLKYAAAPRSKMTFTISFTLQNFTLPTVATVISPKRGAQPVFVPYSTIKKGSMIVVDSPDLLCVRSGYTDETILSNLFVYQNKYPNYIILGSMFSVDSDRWDTFKNVSIYAAETVNLGGAMLINNDATDTAYTDYGILTGGPETITIDATFASAGWIGAKPQDQTNFPGVYLTKINMQQDVPAALIAGAPIGTKNTTLLTTYRQNNKNQLPQFIPSSVWSLMAPTHDLDFNSLVFEFQPTLPTLAYNGRTGFVISDNYPFLSNSQSSTTPFVMETGDSSPFTVAFTVTTKSPNKDATVVVDSGTGNPFSINLNTITVPYTKAFTTKKVSVVINGGTGASNGTYVTYTATEWLQNLLYCFVFAK